MVHCSDNATRERHSTCCRKKVKQVREHWTTSLEIEFHKSKNFMDYLHGDVNTEEAEIACLYEYARESRSFWEAAQKRDQIRALSTTAKCPSINIAFQVLEQYPVLRIEQNFWAELFLECLSFPKKDWNELSRAERNRITRFYNTEKTPPLPTTDIGRLKAMRVLARFETMANNAKPAIKRVTIAGTMHQKIKLVPPVLQKHESDSSVYCVIFDLDFSKSEKQLVEEFRKWLRLPEYRKKLNTLKKSKIGTTGKALDRLKSLALFRLYREVGNDWNKANEFADKHRKESKKFHDARKGQSNEVGLAKALLGSEESYFLKAKNRALTYLRELMPSEFKASDAAEDPWKKEWLKEIGQPKKISKRIS
jgi:hypothetical protein